MPATANQRRILLVDDSPLVHEFARIALEDVGGWELTCVGSGADALRHDDGEPLDAVLVDVEMPDMDGPQTVAALTDAPATRDVPKVFLTAHEDPAELERLAALDVAGVLVKPIDLGSLAGELAALLGWDR
jgi:CheY-like chemotaxis protein